VRNHTTVEVGVEDLVGSRTGQTQLQKQASPPDWFPLYRMRVGTEDSSRSDAHLAMFVSAHFFNQKVNKGKRNKHKFFNWFLKY
jgi:hypothetical protein